MKKNSHKKLPQKSRKYDGMDKDVIQLKEYRNIEIQILYNISDMINGTPIQRFNRVMDEIATVRLLPTCNRPNCRFLPKFSVFGGRLYQQSMIVRQTHDICPICNTNSLSYYGTNACYECATQEDFPAEFATFHSFCQ